jgi:hypothetical protein
MLLPTQDKELIIQINKAIRLRCNFDWDGYCTGFSPDGMAREITDILEKLGYYKGLPSSIEEALNSGDGTYKP